MHDTQYRDLDLLRSLLTLGHTRSTLPLQMTRSVKCDKCSGSGSKSGKRYTCEVRAGGGGGAGAGGARRHWAARYGEGIR